MFQPAMLVDPGALEKPGLNPQNSDVVSTDDGKPTQKRRSMAEMGNPFTKKT